MKSIFIVLFIFSIINELQAQNKPIVVVDGFFTNKDSAFVVEYLRENIKEITTINPDSSQKILGEKGKYGIVNILTHTPQNKKSKFFRTKENIMFGEEKNIIVDGNEVEDFDVNSLNPEKIVAVKIFTPLKSVQKYGMSRRGGVIIIETKD